MSSFYNPNFVHVSASSRSGNDGSFQTPQDATPLPPTGIQYPYLYWQPHPFYHWPSYPPHQPSSRAPERGTSCRLNYTGFSRWDDGTQGERDRSDDWCYSSDASSDASTSESMSRSSESTSESESVSSRRSGESKPPNFLGANMLGLGLAENQYYTSNRRVSPSNGAPRTDERQTPKYPPTPRFTAKHHTPPFTVEHQELQPLSPTGNRPSASRSEPATEEWITRSFSAESVDHGLKEECSDASSALKTEICSVGQLEPLEASLPCDDFPEPIWLNGPPRGPKPVINLKPTRPISMTSESSAATFSEFSLASHSSTSDWVHPPFVPGLSSSNVTAKPVRTISPVSVASEASSATFSFATHSPSIGSARSHGSFDSVDSTSTIRPPGEIHSVNEAKPIDSTFPFITHSSSDWVHPPFVPGLSRSNVTPKPVRRISAVSVASEDSEATFSFATHSPSIGSIRSHGSFDSVDSTSTIRPPGEAKSFASSATSSLPNHASSSDWVHPPFVPGSSRSNVTPKPVRRISDVSMASEASSATFSFATHSPSIGSVRSHGSFDSVDSTSTVRPLGRLEFVNEAKSSVTLTPKQSTAAPADVFVDTSISLSQFERSARKPDLFSGAKPNHDLECLASTPRPTPGGLDTPFNSPAATHSQESTPRKSNDRTGHVVNKLTQYVEVSEGPLRMWPNHGGAIVPVIDNNKTNKPSGSAIGKVTKDPFTTSTAPHTDHHDASPKSGSSQARKPSEKLNLCSQCAAKIESTPSTPRATVDANESNDRLKQSSGSFSSFNYHVVDYEEHRGYYYVIMGNEKGEEVGHMILRK